ncbi:hypothetical protein [Paenibacillus marinisediminis]
MRIVSHLILWMLCTLLITGAAIGLEYVEGYKITTTEYMGLRNIGYKFAIFVVIYLPTAFLYPVVQLPLSWLIRRIPQVRASFILFGLIIAAVWAAGGWRLFHMLYKPWFVQEYELFAGSSIIIFGIAGLIYAGIDWSITRRTISHGTGRGTEL